MALTVTRITEPHPIAPGTKRAVYEVTFDSSYPTGGEAWDLSADFTTLFGITVNGDDTTDGVTEVKMVGTRAAGGITASTLLLAAFTAGAEVANTTNLSGLATTVVVEGV
jgi:hypothetical protein